jgi:hemoglobin
MATSIYEQIGGSYAVGEAVEDFYDRVFSDRKLARYFAGTDMARQKAHLRAFIAAALGGPNVYAGRDMHAAHAGRRITGPAFDSVVGHLAATLEGIGVPPTTIEAIAGKLLPLRAQIVGA